jgi:hypothetical protein
MFFLDSRLRGNDNHLLISNFFGDESSFFKSCNFRVYLCPIAHSELT